MFVLEYTVGGTPQFQFGACPKSLRAAVRAQANGASLALSEPIRTDRLHLFPAVQARLNHP
ncbi:hypothetical protein IHN32_00060 [Deinococcus sp. 14RED07]|jgi:hypothetical protein|uniref:hypothetical protein n=1 Tax=unclassified Deinococcus TaxID=2623546 RepID=UPI001E2C6174|nr:MULTISPECIES: hypothetical protein [unclassified Deinococcus]MCD0164575.1 hypothetical protein [Deinococcus sp. 12RED42]MCD0174350.1 hypothetical protein [Deinococcus sp. 14RED07]